MLQPLERDTFVLHHFFLFVVWNILNSQLTFLHSDPCTIEPLDWSRLDAGLRILPNITSAHTYNMHGYTDCRLGRGDCDVTQKWASAGRPRSSRRPGRRQHSAQMPFLTVNSIPLLWWTETGRKKKVSVTGRRVGETFRSGGYKDTHTQTHTIALA